MATSRLVLAFLITVVCVAQATAQSSLSNSPSLLNPSAASSPLTFLNETSTSEAFSITNPSPASNSQDEFKLSFPSGAQSESTSSEKTDASFGPAFHLYKKNLQSMQSDNVCYTIRSYRVARDDPHSDTTRAAGYSTCQPSAQYRVKTAVQSSQRGRDGSFTY